ncbi:MAG TPA: branched-chain amino acid transaminase [Gemmatimonadaceae bacterium]|nr:branched-chain amino acid transaminase [Gemmatimonadaceae bacterium]
MAEPSTGRTTRIWRDGQFVAWDDATIHVMSHAVHYASSVFEGIRCYETPGGSAIFRAADHMRRLQDSCRIYRMPMRYDLDTLVQAASDTVNANDLRHCYLRPIVVRTGEQMGVYGVDAPVETFIIAWNWGSYLGDEALQHGVDVCVSSWRRAAPDTFPGLAKASGNYLSSQLSKMEARINKYSEGIMLDSFGHVAEGSGENLFVVKDGVIFTASLGASILKGITRDSVMVIARDLGYEVREEAIPRELLYIADEAFFSGTAAELTPIRSVDRIQVGDGKPGAITRAIQTQYMGICKGELEDRFGWLTMVPETVTIA